MVKARIKKYKYHLLGAIVIILVFAFPFTNLFVPYPEHREPSQKFLAENAEAIKKNVPDVEFWITTDKNRYFIGEEIRIKLHFKNKTSGAYNIDVSTYDRSGRFEENKFIIDGPEKGWVDPLERVDYFSMHGGLGRGSSKPFVEATREYALNDYIRFDKPGTYYISCNTELVNKNPDGVSSNTELVYVNPSGAVNLASLPTKIQILEPRYLNTFFKSHFYAFLTYFQSEKIRMHALAKLRYLGNHEAIDIFVHHIGAGENNENVDTLRGIIGSRDYEYAKKVLISVIENPKLDIIDSHLFTFKIISLPQELIDQVGVSLNVKTTVDSLRLYNVLYKMNVKMDKLENMSLEIMFENLKNYYDKKKANACYMLMKKRHSNINGREMTNKYAQIPEMRRLTAANFGSMDAKLQYELLGDIWKNISCREFEPVLEKIIQDRMKIAQDPKSQSGILEFAKLRLLLLQGREKEARELLFADMKRAQSIYMSFYSREILDSFKDEALPDMDDDFLKCLKKNKGNSIVPCLIRKYATRKIIPEIVKLLVPEKQDYQNSFDLSLFGYMMKFDRDAALKELKSALLRGDSVWSRILFKDFPDEAEEVYLDAMGEVNDEKASSLLITLEVYGSSKCIDRIIDKFEEFSKKQIEGFGESGESKSFWRRGNSLVNLLDNKNMLFSKAQKDRLFSLLTAEEKKVFEEVWQAHK